MEVGSGLNPDTGWQRNYLLLHADPTMTHPSRVRLRLFGTSNAAERPQRRVEAGSGKPGLSGTAGG